jgi:hypothetical protein
MIVHIFQSAPNPVYCFAGDRNAKLPPEENGRPWKYLYEQDMQRGQTGYVGIQANLDAILDAVERGECYVQRGEFRTEAKD